MRVSSRLAKPLYAPKLTVCQNLKSIWRALFPALGGVHGCIFCQECRIFSRKPPLELFASFPSLCSDRSLESRQIMHPRWSGGTCQHGAKTLRRDTHGTRNSVQQKETLHHKIYWNKVNICPESARQQHLNNNAPFFIYF